MKKGSFILGVLVFMIMSVSVFPAQPVLNNIPDIVIGDNEDNSFTIDRNFFRFTNAFLFDDYIASAGVPKENIKWSFMGGNGTIEINDLGPETTNNVNPTNDLRAASNTASFRNISLSPKPDQPAYANPASSSYTTQVTFYASDGTDVADQEINVYTKDNEGDAVINKISPSFFDPFETQTTWKCFAGLQEAPTTIGYYSATQQRVECKFPSSPLPSPGFFQWLKVNNSGNGVEESIVFEPNNLYVMKLKISTDSDDTVPNIRVRAQSIDNVWSACGIFGDYNNPAQKGAPKTTPGYFYLIWEPQGTTSNAFIAFDLYTSREYTGEIYIDDVSVYKVPLADTGTPTTELTITNFSDWGTIGSTVTKSAANITYADTSTWGSAGKFATLTNPITENAIYRLKYTVSKIGIATPDQFRMRVSDSFNGAYSSYFVFNDTVGSVSTIPKEYKHYHWAVNGRDTQGDLTVFLDTVDLSVSAATLVLSKVVIEKINMPILK